MIFYQANKISSLTGWKSFDFRISFIGGLISMAVSVVVLCCFEEKIDLDLEAAMKAQFIH